MTENMFAKSLRLVVVAALFVAGYAGRVDGGDILFEGPVGEGYLKIERHPDNHFVAPQELDAADLHSRDGTIRLVLEVNGNGSHKYLYTHLLWRSQHPARHRLCVETVDRCYYQVFSDRKLPGDDLLAKVAETLNVEFVPARRPMSAFVLRANDEEQNGLVPFHGRFKWPSPGKPEARLKRGEYTAREIQRFPSGGVLFCMSKFDNDDSIPQDDNRYFDGVTLNELATYFEDNRRVPFVNKANGEDRYSFFLPDDFWKRFRYDKTVVVPGLGISVASEELEIDALVVRPKKDHNRVPDEPEVNYLANQCVE
jgi:hypothetical protein